MEIYTSNRLENLLSVLAQGISGEKSSTASIFSRPADVVVIQSLGMAKWLQQNLAEQNGIAANIEFPFLKNFIQETLIKYGFSKEENTWDRDTLTWRIFRFLPKLEERHEILNQYVNADSRRRFQLAEKLGSLYDQYLVYRFDWLQYWGEGKRPPVKPGNPELLENQHQPWQMDLWQMLSGQSEDSFQHCLMNFICHRDFTRENLGLPETISIFGVTNMPPVFIDFFEALSEVCEVRFYYLNPCAEYWGDLSMKKSLFVRHSKDDIPHNDNYLLKSWGLLGRDFLNQLLERTEFNVMELFEKPSGTYTLEEIQISVLGMQDRFYPRELLDDGSIKINACHNPRRELEVLHDYLLKVLAENSHIEPRDIIVMAPNIQDYSPHIRNIFDEENSLPFSVSDQDISTSPLISTYKNILQLYKSRLTGNDILDIVEHPDVLRKFGLVSDDIRQIREWIKSAAIRWGRDALYRQQLGLPAFEQNSWKFGFDRLLAGYAFSEELLYEDSAVVPVGEKGVILGKFKTAVDTLFEIQEILKKSHSPVDWCRLLQDVLLDCFIEDNENANEHNFITQSISKLETYWRLAGIEEDLPAEIVLKAFNAMIDESSSSYGFLDNGITFCSLLPMRSIPAKVVCLLGIDEGAYPRSDRESGFDLMTQFWRQGDRTKRLDDRYLFLESLLSARNFFYVSFKGIDENENTKVPPSIVLSEFMEFLEKSQSSIAIEYHPLHAFSPAYFESTSVLYSYSHRNFLAAKTLSEPNKQESIFCEEDLDFAEGFEAEDGIQISLIDLADFIKNPARQFLKHQLGASLWQDDYEELPDTEPFENLNSLQAFKLRNDLTEKLLEHAEEIDSENLRKKITGLAMASGEFQPGTPGSENFNEIFQECHALAHQLVVLQQGREEKKAEFEIKFPDYNVTLTGEVDRLFGEDYIPYHVGSDSFKHRFKYTINYLALLSSGEYSMNYCVKGSDKVAEPAGRLDSEQAKQHLEELIEFYLEGMHRPMPFFGDCFDSYMKAKNDPLSAVAKKWYPDSFSIIPSLSEDEANIICYGREFPGEKPQVAEEMLARFEFIADLYKKIWEGEK